MTRKGLTIMSRLNVWAKPNVYTIALIDVTEQQNEEHVMLRYFFILCRMSYLYLEHIIAWLTMTPTHHIMGQWFTRNYVLSEHVHLFNSTIKR